MTLKQKLNNLIKQSGFLTLDQVYRIGAEMNSKQKTVERELNPSRSPDIETVKNDKHQIVGYRWKDQTPSYERRMNTKECSCWHFTQFGYCYDSVEQRKVDQTLFGRI